MSLDDSNYLKKLFINEVINALPETVDDEVIVDAVNDYLKDNPVNAGATVEEAAQIKANKEAIEELQNGGVGEPGEDGVSPTIRVTSIEGGHRVTITDVNGTKSFDVMDGKDGTGGGGSSVELDTTLKESGKAADAGAVGEKLSSLNEQIADVQSGAVINQNGGGMLKIWAGTQTEYDALLIKNDDTVYLIDGMTTGGNGGGSEGEEEQPTTYSVAYNLTKVSTSNDATTIEAGAQYSATLTPNSGYEMDSASVYMGGTDVTDSAYSNGTISIASVTGNIVITAVAVYTQDDGAVENGFIYRFTDIADGKIDDSGNDAASTWFKRSNDYAQAEDAVALIMGDEAASPANGSLTCKLVEYDSAGNFVKITNQCCAVTTNGNKIRAAWDVYTDSSLSAVDGVMRLKKISEENITKGQTIDATGQAISDNPQNISDYIEYLGADTKYGIVSTVDFPVKVAWYDANKTFLERKYAQNNRSVLSEIPLGAKYYRYSYAAAFPTSSFITL